MIPRSHLSTLLLATLALPALTLGACGDPPAGDDDRGDASFAAMTDEQRAEEFFRATGSFVNAPNNQVLEAELSNRQTADCPARQDAGEVITFSAAGCVRPDGSSFDGRLVAHNVPMFDDIYGDELTVDLTRPMVIEMETFRHGDFTFDGVVEQSTPVPAEAQRFTQHAAFDIRTSLRTSSYAYDAECTRRGLGGPCTIEGFIDHSDRGSYAITGAVDTRADAASGVLELRGADTLRVDLDATTDGCAPYTIDDQPAGRVGL